jgi:hypothetical protein
MTLEELLGWAAYLELKADREREAMEKARRRR